MDHLHVPVLLEEVRDWMQPASGKVFIDGTLGHGGHTEMLLEESGPDGVVVGIERDARNLRVAQGRLKRFGFRAMLVHGNYSDLSSHLRALNIDRVDGILLDLGFSSAHVDDPARGFSFMHDGPLDMRYNAEAGETAADIVNTWHYDDLVELFVVYGEEKRAQEIAKAIVTFRRGQTFKTTTQLADLIASTIGRSGRIHPATKVFQALRIAVNDELGGLKEVLPQCEKLLAPGGRLLVISFHSLEDRIVKQYIKRSNSLSRLTKKPIPASRNV